MWVCTLLLLLHTLLKWIQSYPHNAHGILTCGIKRLILKHAYSTCHMFWYNCLYGESEMRKHFHLRTLSQCLPSHWVLQTVHLYSLLSNAVHYTAVKPSKECHVENKTAHNKIYLHTIVSEFTYMFLLLLPLQEGVTALFMASQEGLTSIVKLLLAAKANPDVQNQVMIIPVACLVWMMY